MVVVLSAGVTPLVQMVFGSHLYGTDTPLSDHDYKGVHLPCADEILLNKIMPSVSEKRIKRVNERNTSDDVDRESYPLHRFLGFVMEGQMTALDMLFAPAAAWVGTPDPLWRAILADRHRLLGRNVKAFVGYCRTQANRYGIRGSRVHALRHIVAWLDAAIARTGKDARLAEAADGLEAFIAEEGLEATGIEFIPHPGRPEPMPHLLCCGRKVPYANKLVACREVYQRVLDAYGRRAMLAEQNQGIDWKAVSHAVRAGHQARELLATGMMTLPLPNAAHVLAIKQGLLPYRQVAEEIEALIEQVEAASATSVLPETPDRAFVEAIVCEAHRRVVCAGSSA